MFFKEIQDATTVVTTKDFPFDNELSATISLESTKSFYILTTQT